MLAQGKVADGVHSGGFYVAPTLFGEVPRDHQLACDEVFGPVLAAMPFDTEDDAIELANATEFGLLAGVWTRDGGRRRAWPSRCGAGRSTSTLWRRRRRGTAVRRREEERPRTRKGLPRARGVLHREDRGPVPRTLTQGRRNETEGQGDHRHRRRERLRRRHRAAVRGRRARRWRWPTSTPPARRPWRPRSAPNAIAVTCDVTKRADIDALVQRDARRVRRAHRRRRQQRRLDAQEPAAAGGRRGDLRQGLRRSTSRASST